MAAFHSPTSSESKRSTPSAMLMICTTEKVSVRLEKEEWKSIHEKECLLIEFLEGK